MKLRHFFFVDNPKIEHELFLLSFRNLPIHVIGQICLSTVVAVDSWRNVSHFIVLVWSACIFVSCAALALGGLFFRKQAQAPVNNQTLRRWQLCHVFMLGTVGVAWGSCGFMFAPVGHEQNLMVMIAFSGVFAYSAATNAPQDPLAFAVSAAIGTVILMSQIPAAFGEHTLFILAMCFLYFFSLTFANVNARTTLLASIRLRLANEVLAKENAQNAARAEQASRDKSEFLAVASHDLRQPVHALLLLLEAYRQQVPAANDHPLMQHIAEAGQAIRNLFNALMELSRLDSGTEQVTLSLVDLPEMLQRLQSRMLTEAERKGLSLRCLTSKTLAWRMACTDSILLERIVGNLLSNAIRYTEVGGVLLTLRNAHGSKGLWLEVWDTGIGIEDSERARIFNPYVQIGNTERDRSKGLGLGLAIVSHLVTLLSLQFELKSQPQRGSCFRLYLPFGICTDQQLADAEPKRRVSPVSPVRLQGRRILLVEDDPMALQAMQILLGGWGVDLRCASLGDASVLAHCSADWNPECVLCDFRLPGVLDGIAVLGLVLDRYPDAVGILQTGELAKRVMAQAEEAGYMVLFKPIDPIILGSTLNAIFEESSV